MWKSKWILLNIRLNDLLDRVHGSPCRSQAYSSIVTHIRPLPSHPLPVSLTQLSVVPVFISACQQLYRKARALNGLRPPPHQSPQARSNNFLDYRPKRKQLLLKSIGSTVNSPLVHHFSNAQQQMFKTMRPLIPIRLSSWLQMSIHNSMTSRLSYL